MKMNGFRHRILFGKTGSKLRAHLGPDQQRYLDGWVNIDKNMFTGKRDIWTDLRNLLRFPMPRWMHAIHTIW